MCHPYFDPDAFATMIILEFQGFFNVLILSVPDFPPPNWVYLYMILRNAPSTVRLLKQQTVVVEGTDLWNHNPACTAR